MSRLLEVGDVIQGWDLLKYKVGSELLITQVTKTLAKTDNGQIFYREVDSGAKKPDDTEYLGSVKRKPEYGSRQYFVIKK